MTTTDNPRPTHLGHNVKRLREILKIKQETLADQLGSDWNQKKISLLESKEVIEPALLDQLAKAMNVPVDAIKDYNEEATIQNIQNNYEGSNNGGSNHGPNYYNCQIGAVDKRLEALEEKLAQLMKVIEKR
ncbi:hypothetical protein WSM22_31470 [Cytophagales bacterium WSM2-2]|nr:hypothetical protein WSM22_31470 [Cytophagales bacterium WSM2-2]